MTVFISYSSPDYDQAVRLQVALVRANADEDVYFSPKRNHAGAFWMDRLQSKLEESDVVVLLIGEEVGYWQQMEYRAALHLHSTDNKLRILPVILGGRAPGLPFLQQFHALLCNGNDVSSVTSDLLAAIEQDPGHGSQNVAWRTTNPYRGLEAMEAQDAAFFFGRESLTANVLSSVVEHPQKLITLVGNSGVGKSSVVFAGVYGALRARGWNDEQTTAPWPDALLYSNRWLTLSFSPGDSPLKSLVAAFVQTYASSPAEVEAEVTRWLPLLSLKSGDTGIGDLIEATKTELTRAHRDSPPERIVLYMDQAEELYLRARPEEARLVARFLADALQREDLVVLASLRSDFYGVFQADARLFPLTHRIDIPPLDLAGITAMLMKPAKVLGVTFEQPLLIRKIAEIAAQEEGALPMLSFLMRESWEKMRSSDRQEPVLQLPTDMVDVSSPLTKQADRFIAEHPSCEPALKDLFTLRLCHVPKGGRAVRRRARRAECPDTEWNLATKLAGEQWRLLSMGEDIDGSATVSVAHEALLSSWSKLADWIDDRRDFLTWKGHLEEARLAWEEAPQRDQNSALLLGLNLSKARAYYKDHSSDLTETDRDFINASIAHDEAKLQAEKKRSKRLRQIGLAVTASLAGLCLLLAQQVWRANLAEDTAEIERQLRQEIQAEKDKTEKALKDANEQREIAATQRNDAVQARQSAEASEAKALNAQRSAEEELLARRSAEAATDAERKLRQGAEVARAAAEARAEMWRALFEINETIVARRTRGDRSVAAFQDIAFEIDAFEEKIRALGLNPFEEKVIYDQAANRTMEAFVDTRFDLRNPDEFHVFVTAAQQSKEDLVGLDISTSSAEKLNLSKRLTKYVDAYWEYLQENSVEKMLGVLQSAAALREHVLKVDPSNADCMCKLTRTYSELERLYRSLGQNDLADQTLRKRLDLARTVPASVQSNWGAYHDHFVDAILESAAFGILSPNEEAELFVTVGRILQDPEKDDVGAHNIMKALLMMAERQSEVNINSDSFDRILGAVNEVASSLPKERKDAIADFPKMVASFTLTRFAEHRRPVSDLLDAINIVEAVGYNRESYMIAAHVERLAQRQQNAAAKYKWFVANIQDDAELLKQALKAQRILASGGNTVALDWFLDALRESGRTEAATRLAKLLEQSAREVPKTVRRETSAAEGKPFDFQADLTLDTLLYGVGGDTRAAASQSTNVPQQKRQTDQTTQNIQERESTEQRGNTQTFDDVLEKFKLD